MSDRATICLGANTPDASSRLDDAFALLRQSGRVLASTPLYPTDPEYAGDAAPYLNRIVILETDFSFDELSAMTKEYQTKVRNEADALPLVAVDIDIVEWNGFIKRPTDASAAYFRKGLELLQQGAKNARDTASAVTGINIGETVQ